MFQNPQQRTDRAGVTGEGNGSTGIGTEDIVQQSLHPRIKLLVRFAMIRLPQFVALGHGGFEYTMRERGAEEREG